MNKLKNESKKKVPFTTATNKLTKVKNVYSENYKILLKEMKYSLNKYEDIPRSWVKRFNIVKMALVPRSIHMEIQGTH